MTHPNPRRLIFILIITFLLLSLCVASYFAQSVPLRLDEKACRLNFSEEKITASLALKNNTSRPLAASILVELIDAENHLRYRSEQLQPIKSGASTISFDLMKVEMKKEDPDDEKIWWRLHYAITPQDDETRSRVEGFISASQITPDIFDLQVFATDESKAGTRYQARVRTAHPITEAPVSGVKIEAEATLEIDDKEQVIKASGITNEEGYAVDRKSVV